MFSIFRPLCPIQSLPTPFRCLFDSFFFFFFFFLLGGCTRSHSYRYFPLLIYCRSFCLDLFGFLIVLILITTCGGFPGFPWPTQPVVFTSTPDGLPPPLHSPAYFLFEPKNPFLIPQLRHCYRSTTRPPLHLSTSWPT